MIRWLDGTSANRVTESSDRTSTQIIFLFWIIRVIKNSSYVFHEWKFESEWRHNTDSVQCAYVRAIFKFQD